MRYHKAEKISPIEAKFIIDNTISARNYCVVVQHHSEWFDVRRMTEEEINSFIDDLNWARLQDEMSGFNNPH